jgi:exonuclease SbcD
VACFPFLREGRVVDFMKDTGEWYREYAARVQGICARYNDALVSRGNADEVLLLVSHFLVSGVKVDRSAPRGERELHMGEAYAATPQAIPVGPQYVALGHIHAPQKVPGAPVPAEYAGSLLPLDFGEAGEKKRVVIVDVRPGSLAVAESVPINAGRPLVRVTDEWHAIEARAEELTESYLDLTVRTASTDTTLSDRARELFPYLVRVRARRPEAPARERTAKEHREWDALYAEFHRREFGQEAPDDLLTLLRGVLEEADASA